MYTGVIVPQATGGTAYGWELVDYRTVSATSAPAAGGAAVVELPMLGPDEMWIIDHAAVYCTSTTQTELRWYAGQVAPHALLDGSGKGNFDVADWPGGLQIAPGISLVSVWSHASDGAVGTLTAQARVLRKAA